MKEIQLTKGFVAIVDDEDYESLSKNKWHAILNGRYAARSVKCPKRAMIYMHRQIMGNESEKEIDHINGNGLDNRKSNLRFATRAQNSRNKKKRTNTSSKYKGVYFHKASGLWHARIRVNYKYISLKCYKSEEEAYAVYCKAAKELHGEFARLE